ncbi:MAG: hypothetical protein KC613_25230, partial [Myxococcales bacterium]|nr:hypothetical protein [Myxococcales bacterium]
MKRLTPLSVAQACAVGGVAASTALTASLVPQLTPLGNATAIWRLGLTSMSVVIGLALFYWTRRRLARAMASPPADAARRTAANDFPFALARALFLAATGLGTSTTVFLWRVPHEPSTALVVGVVTYLLYVLPVLGVYLIARSALRPHAAGPPGAGPVRGVRQSVALRLAFAVQLPVVVCSVGIVLVEQSDGASYDLALEDYYRERYARTAGRIEAHLGAPVEGVTPPAGVFRDAGAWVAVPAAMDRVRPLALRLPPILLLALITLGSAVMGRWLAGEVTGAVDGVRRTLKGLQSGDLEGAHRAADAEGGPGLAELAGLLRALGGALDGLQAQREALREAAARRLAAEQAKARFLAHISHELKSPLHS